MKTKKEKQIKCKVVRAFLIEGVEQPILKNGKPNIITLGEAFAREMKSSLKVEFVGGGDPEPDTEEEETETETDPAQKKK